MDLMRTYLYFVITASIGLYASAFMAMAEPVTPRCCADASPARAEGSREQDVTLSFVAPKGASVHGVSVEMYDAKHNLVMKTTTDDAVVITRLPLGEYYGTAQHAGARENFHASVHAGHDHVTVVTFDA